MGDDASSICGAASIAGRVWHHLGRRVHLRLPAGSGNAYYIVRTPTERAWSTDRGESWKRCDVCSVGTQYSSWCMAVLTCVYAADRHPGYRRPCGHRFLPSSRRFRQRGRHVVRVESRDGQIALACPRRGRHAPADPKRFWKLALVGNPGDRSTHCRSVSRVLSVPIQHWASGHEMVLPPQMTSMRFIKLETAMRTCGDVQSNSVAKTCCTPDNGVPHEFIAW